MHVVVTGASGLLGASFSPIAAARWPLTALHGRHAVELPGVRSRALDLTHPRTVCDELDRISPTVIVHLAAMTNVDGCEAHPAEAFRVNAEVTDMLAAWCAANGCGMVFMSTDSVFDGRTGGYTEDDEPGPLNVYARSKLRAEECIRTRGPRHVIVRANMYGWNLQPRQSLAEWALARLESGQHVPGFVDVKFSPLLTNTLSEALCLMIERELQGTFHVASANALSKYEFLRELALTFGHDVARVEPSELASAHFPAARPRDTSLDNGKFVRTTGQRMPQVSVDLGRFRALRDFRPGR